VAESEYADNRWLVTRVELWERELCTGGSTEEEAIQIAKECNDISKDDINFVALANPSYWKVTDLNPVRIMTKIMNLLIMIQTTLSISGEHPELVHEVEQMFESISTDFPIENSVDDKE